MESFSKTIYLKFDPKIGNLRELFENKTARTLWMLWKLGHITDQHFESHVLEVARNIDKTQPKTNGELAACFPTRGGTHSYWTESDVWHFCERAIPYFNGERECHYAVKEAE